MALNETKRQLLAKILDHVKNTGGCPEKQLFRATVAPETWAALDQLASTGFLYEDQTGRIEYLPTFAGLAEMRQEHAFAASEIQRALETLPVLKREYPDGIHDKQRSVAAIASEVGCEKAALRRTLRTMNRVRTIIGRWDPPTATTFETFWLVEGVMLINPVDLNPPPRPSPEPGSLDDILLGLTDQPPRAPPPAPPRAASTPSASVDAVYALNRNARTLLQSLHAAHLQVQGAAFSLRYGGDDMPFDFPTFRAAAQRLEERGLARWVGHADVTSTAEGVHAAENTAILDRVLPIDPRGSVPSMNDTIHEANARARRLLAFLQQWSMQGTAFRIGPCQETYDATGLNEEEYKRAADRLIRMGLAEHQGTGYLITVTDRGVRVAESAAALDRDLPVAAASEERRALSVADKRKVFVIHGRNDHAVKEVGIFLRAMGLEPVWFRDVRKEMGGSAFIAKIVERGMEKAHGVLALFTPDEYSALRPRLRKHGESGEKVERWQARPNVQFEAGMAYGRDPDRVAFVLFGDVKLFTDVSGIHVFWPTNQHGPESDRALLRGVLAGGMQCAVNMHSDDWMTAGDFDAVVAGLSGVSPRDPFGPEPTRIAPSPRAPSAGPAPVPEVPAANVPVVSAMDDDEAMVHLTRWLDQMADDAQMGMVTSPMLYGSADISRWAGVPEAKVALLPEVAAQNAHFGVTVSRLQSGKFRLDVGARSVRIVD